MRRVENGRCWSGRPLLFSSPGATVSAWGRKRTLEWRHSSAPLPASRSPRARSRKRHSARACPAPRASPCTCTCEYSVRHTEPCRRHSSFSDLVIQAKQVPLADDPCNLPSTRVLLEERNCLGRQSLRVSDGQCGRDRGRIASLSTCARTKLIGTTSSLIKSHFAQLPPGAPGPLISGRHAGSRGSVAPIALKEGGR